MARLYFALDLNDNPEFFAEYERWHQPDQIWPDILESLSSSGVEDAEIFRTHNRLVLVLDVAVDFSLDKKAAADAVNERVIAWETMMWKYQKPLPWAHPGQKWVPMQRIFSLRATSDSRLTKLSG
jgi:L-rhamnose mutarotase